MDDPLLLRYSRHILLDELGPDAQTRFASAHALIVGVGGLGAPVAQFLAAAGVGTNMATRGAAAVIPAETLLELKLTAPVTVVVQP